MIVVKTANGIGSKLPKPQKFRAWLNPDVLSPPNHTWAPSVGFICPITYAIKSTDLAEQQQSAAYHQGEDSNTALFCHDWQTSTLRSVALLAMFSYIPVHICICPSIDKGFVMVGNVNFKQEIVFELLWKENTGWRLINLEGKVP